MNSGAVSADELLRDRGGEQPPLLLDVRSRSEFVAGHINGAVHMPFWSIPWRRAELRAEGGQPIVIYCGHGPRAELAAAMLRYYGFTRVGCLSGHMSGWRRNGFPVTQGD
jgi:rhodanese-related sulfurtransferase